MWYRNCRVLGFDPFEKILSDIAKYFNEDDWRTVAETFNGDCTTQRKHRRAMRTDLQLVSFCLLFDILKISSGIYNFAIIILEQVPKENGVSLDKYGRVSLGQDNYLYLSRHYKGGQVIY